MTGLNDALPCWLELGGRPARELLDFYADRLGWTYDTNPADAEYCRAFAGGLKVAGFGGPPTPRPSRGWRVYVGVADLDLTLELALRSGADSQSGVIRVPDGRFVLLSDPLDAFVGLFESAQDPGTTREPGPGRVSGWTMQSPDPTASREFYATVFGVRVLDQVEFRFARRADWVVRVAAPGGHSGDLSDPMGNVIRVDRWPPNGSMRDG